MAINYLIGRSPRAFEEPKSQVYRATHIEQGGEWQRSPLMRRSFISFTYGGKSIEDFGLIAITKEDRMNKSLYSEVHNLITTYDIRDGQYYWGTSMAARKIDLVLTTDGITEEQLNDFIYWFKPGVSRELILAEHPNRVLYARIAATPQMSMLPFEKPAKIKFNNKSYYTSTTLYKGDISISFISDEPYWKAINDFFPTYYADIENKMRKENLFLRRAGHDVYHKILEDPDFVKVIIEDHIPCAEQVLTSPILLGDNKMVSFDYSIVSPNDISNLPTGVNSHPLYNDNYIAEIDKLDTPLLFEGRTVTIEDTAEKEVTFDSNSSKYLFYSGTAPCKPIIQFTLKPQIDITRGALSSLYLKFPSNSYTKNNNLTGKDYDTIKIGNKEFNFTIPSVLADYNRAIALAYQFRFGAYNEAGPELVNERAAENLFKEMLKEKLHNRYVREFALKWNPNATLSTVPFFCQQVVNDTNSHHYYQNFLFYMTGLLMENTIDANSIYDVTFKFNSLTGEATGYFMLPTERFFADASQRFELVEINVGDMVRSPYLVIDQRNNFSESGLILEENCTELQFIHTNSSNPEYDPPGTIYSLKDFKIEYHNMYF